LGTAVTELGEGSYKVAGGGELLVKKTTVASSSGDEAGAAQQAPKVQSAPLVFVGEPARLATATRSAASSSGTPADRGTGEPLVASFSGDPRFITEDPAAFELASMPAASTQRAASDASRNAADTSSTRESAVVSRAAPNVEARIVELEDGTLCLVCVRDGAVSAIYKLRRRPTAR
jgi:hypothetical protein